MTYFKSVSRMTHQLYVLAKMPKWLKKFYDHRYSGGEEFIFRESLKDEWIVVQVVIHTSEQYGRHDKFL